MITFDVLQEAAAEKEKSKKHEESMKVFVFRCCLGLFYTFLTLLSVLLAGCQREVGVTKGT